MFSFPVTLFSDAGTPPPPSSYIVSIQQVAITIATNGTSGTATISSVNTANTVILWGGFTTTVSATGMREFLPAITLTNATTVTASRIFASVSGSITVYATVVEFAASAIQSIQSGSIAITGSNTTATATISSVTTANAAVFFEGFTTTSSGTSAGVIVGTLELTNSTTVTVTRASTGLTATHNYTVVEFKPGVLSSIQKRSITMNTSATSNTDTISSVNTGNTLLLYNGIFTTLNTWADFLYSLQMTNSTTVTLTRNGTSTTSRTLKYTVLEFASGVINSLQQNTSSFSGSSPVDTTITSVNTGKSAALFLGSHTAATVANDRFSSVNLLNSTTLRNLKSTATTAATNSWQVIEFV
jgi:hypothetical protein